MRRRCIPELVQSASYAMFYSWSLDTILYSVRVNPNSGYSTQGTQPLWDDDLLLGLVRPCNYLSINPTPEILKDIQMHDFASYKVYILPCHPLPLRVGSDVTSNGKRINTRNKTPL
jgi:hypothetical protein